MNKNFIAVFLLTVLLGFQSQAAQETRTSAKPKRAIGTYVGLGNPFPSILGVNAAYNVTNNIRAEIGYGEVEVTTSLSFNGAEFVSETTKATTYAVGGDYLFTDWAVRPLLGARIGYFDITGDGEFSVQGVDKSTFLSYLTAGFDYISGGGYYFGAGLNQAFVGASTSNFYANVGYFF